VPEAIGNLGPDTPGAVEPEHGIAGGVRVAWRSGKLHGRDAEVRRREMQ
jgi:hypothetical protein